MTATTPASARHRRLALVIIAATFLAYAAISANAGVPLAQVDSFIPTVAAISFVADVVVTVLLFAQFSARGSRALLVLASGYLYAGLIVIPHALTFPGAFAPTGLLGAGPQSSAYLSISWRLGLSVTVLLYACLVAGKPIKDAPEPARPATITWAVAFVVFVVGALTLVAIAGDGVLPDLLVNGRVSPWGHGVNGASAIMSLLALSLLLARGRSTLDLWLIVAACGLLAEGAAIALFVKSRFTVGFYGVRVVSLIVSKVVLIALLWETVRLYANLLSANQQLQRERANRLTSAEAVVAAIAHEIRQPLTNINLLAFAGQRLLEGTSPDVSAAKTHFAEIEEDAFRVNQVIDGFRGYFRGDKLDRQAVDVNALTREAMRLLRRELEHHQVAASTQLAVNLPLVQGHAGQPREVILNLVQNSIEAIASTTGGPRSVSITTSRRGPDAIAMSLRDTGPGIRPQDLANIFEPFVTNKAKGTGLGLAICKMIIEQHGGELSAASDETGGARFELTLPAARRSD